MNTEVNTIIDGLINKLKSLIVEAVDITKKWSNLDRALWKFYQQGSAFVQLCQTFDAEIDPSLKEEWKALGNFKLQLGENVKVIQYLSQKKEKIEKDFIHLKESIDNAKKTVASLDKESEQKFKKLEEDCSLMLGLIEKIDLDGSEQLLKKIAELKI